MDEYELLVSEIQRELPIIESDLLSRTGRHGFYRNGRIYIERTLPMTEKREVLSEEYGHYKTSVGTILDQRIEINRKQELQARNIAYKKLISLDKLIDCSEAGLNTPFECAEFLCVSIATLQNTIRFYRQKYGSTYFYKGRIFQFGDSSVMILNTGLQFS